MITVEEARRAIMADLRLLPIKEIPLNEAFWHFAASDIRSPYDHPLFHNSAVDGYAIRWDQRQPEWIVKGEAPAGSIPSTSIGIGECMRIFTGGMLPEGADTVVMQEFVQRTGDKIVHSDKGLECGANVRLQGEHIKKGDVVIGRGEQVTAPAAGLLASVGVGSLKVHERPFISVVITGDEFSNVAAPGKIFNSNDVMLAAALRSTGITPRTFHAMDDAEELENTLRQALSVSDVVITTGGVSVGEHDHVRSAVIRSGATPIFHKVAQKPGKPMLFAMHEGRPIFGLPGNPRAVMVLFWEYVLPAIHAMMGSRTPGPVIHTLPIASDVQLKGERSEFRAARVVNGSVELLADEGSHMLAGLLDADCLVFFPQSARSVKAGSEVEVHLIPRR